MSKPFLKLSASLDRHLTHLLKACPGLTVTMAEPDNLAWYYVGFEWRVNGKLESVSGTGKTLDDAYRLAYAAFGMNTNIW